MSTQIQLRRGTKSEWIATNPILASGEMGFEKDTGLTKIGNGTLTYSALPYQSASFAITASYALNGGNGIIGNTIASASWASSSVSSSYATQALTASYALNGGGSPTISASWASASLSASLASTASYAIIATAAVSATSALTAGFATSAISASWASSSLSILSTSSSYALTASYALNGGGGGGGTTLVTASTYPITSSWSNNAVTASALTASQVQIMNGQLKLLNITTGTYYTVVVSGSVGQETLYIF